MGRHRFGLPAAIAAVLFITGSSALPSGLTIAEMQWHRRVLIVSAPGKADVQLLAQQRILCNWAGGADRDVSVITIDGDKVSGASERAAELRSRYGLSASSFAVALVGKDGHVALRSESPLSGTEIEEVIDAMPMRRSGQR